MLAACPKAARPVLDDVQVDAFEGGDVISMSADQLKQRVIARLEAAKFVVLKKGMKVPDDVTPWRVTLAAGLSEPDVEKGPASTVGVVFELKQKGSLDSFEVRAFEKSAPKGSDVEAIQEGVREALDAALGRAIREARALIDLEAAKDEDLVKKLQDSDQAARDAAMRLLAHRKNRAALPALLEKLRTDDLSEIRRAIGLLVELGAPESVNAIVEATRARDATVQREIVFAVSAIGGDDAEAYLDLVASGAEDPLVRASAEQALTELRNRKKPARAPSGDTP